MCEDGTLVALNIGLFSRHDFMRSRQPRGGSAQAGIRIGSFGTVAVLANNTASSVGEFSFLTHETEPVSEQKTEKKKIQLLEPWGEIFHLRNSAWKLPRDASTHARAC